LKKIIAKKGVSNSSRQTKEWINRTLKRIHRKMVELFGVDFTYFRDIKILDQSNILRQLTQRMRNNLKDNGVVYSDIQWKQIWEGLSKSQVAGFFENFAFYNPKDEVLYISEKLMTDYPEKVIPICTHELSEKLISTYLPSPLKAPTRTLVEAYVEAGKTNNTRKLYELLNTHTDIVFRTVFKEGFCEAIMLQTLRHTDFERKAASLERELLIGHSKCIDLLFNFDSTKKNVGSLENNQLQVEGKEQKVQGIDEKKLAKEILRISQMIKGLSYYLGYPLAKAILEKYGIKGAKVALEYPPVKAKYFADPQTYLTQLEEPTPLINQRR